MKKTILFSCFLLTIASFSYATEKSGDNNAAVQSCLKRWVKHPFDEKNPQFRILSGGSHVMGSGSNIEDTQATDAATLVLVRPGVTVMGGNKVSLLNPHGWYCLDGGVTVLGSMKIDLACNASLASTDTGTTVLGSTDTEGAVTVLGHTAVKRIGCK